MTDRDPRFTGFTWFILLWALVLAGPILWGAAVILADLPDAIGGIADAMAGPNRFGPDGIAEIME